jgi:hypothetical protein
MGLGASGPSCKPKTHHCKWQRGPHRDDKKAERNRKQKEKAFERSISLPSEQHEARIVELAKRGSLRSATNKVSLGLPDTPLPRVNCARPNAAPTGLG